jgi:hypothetical protein
MARSDYSSVVKTIEGMVCGAIRYPDLPGNLTLIELSIGKFFEETEDFLVCGGYYICIEHTIVLYNECLLIIMSEDEEYNTILAAIIAVRPAVLYIGTHDICLYGVS